MENDEVYIGLRVLYNNHEATVMCRKESNQTWCIRFDEPNSHHEADTADIYIDLELSSWWAQAYEIRPCPVQYIPEQHMKLIGALALANTRYEFVALCWPGKEYYYDGH